MLQYRCYFFEKDGSPASWRTLTSQTENEAHDHALGLLAGQPRADKVEVWEQSRLTFSYSRPAMQTPAELRRLCYLALAAAKKENNLARKQAIAACAARLAQDAEALERRAGLDPAKARRISADGLPTGESSTTMKATKQAE